MELLAKLQEVELEDFEMDVGDLEIWLQPGAVAAPRAIPKATKIELIAIIVPRDSGACSRIKLVFAGKFMP